MAADVRVVLEVHEIDPANPATEIAASTVLYDGVITSAPAYCSYVLVNAASMQCSIAFTRLIAAPDTEVRSALPGAELRHAAGRSAFGWSPVQHHFRVGTGFFYLVCAGSEPANRNALSRPGTGADASDESGKRNGAGAWHG